MNTSERLASKLRMLREVHNYTQDYVASVIDVSTNTYSLMEKGQAQYTIERIEKLANLYKMETTDFLKFSDQHIIHSITHSNGNGICSENVNIHNLGVGEEERNLYKDMLNRLEEQNNKLISLIEKLSEKIGNNQ